MAFETYLTVDKKPKKGRRLTFMVSLAAHVALLAVGVASSFASVEPLTQDKQLPITFFNLPTPPAPPPGRPPKKHPTTKPVPKVVPPKANQIVAPNDHKVEDKATEEPGGNDINGNLNGDPTSIGGGGDPVGQEPPHTLSPNVAKGFLAIDPQDRRYRPQMPPGYRGVSVWALLRVCTDRDGNVIDVKVIKGFDASVDAAFVAALRTWRYTPFKVDGRPVPFCTNVRYEVQTTN